MKFYLVSLNVHMSRLACIQSMCLSPDLIPRLQIVSCNYHNFAAPQNLLTQACPHNVLLSSSLNYSDLTLQLFYCADMEKN